MKQPFIIEILIIPHETLPNAYQVRKLAPETFEEIRELGGTDLLAVQLVIPDLLKDVKTIDMLTDKVTREVATTVRDKLNTLELQSVQIQVAVFGKPTTYDQGKSVLQPMFNELLLNPLTGDFKPVDLSRISAHISPEIRAKVGSGFLNRLLQMQRNGLITPEQLRVQLEGIPRYDFEAEVSQETIDKIFGHLLTAPVEFDAGKVLEAMKANPDKVITIDSYSDLGEKGPKE